MKFVGIDNGLSGGIVCLNERMEVIHKFIMPTIKVEDKTEYDIKKLTAMLNEIYIDDFSNENLFVTLESAYPRQVSGKRACFSTGYGYGVIRGILETYGIKYIIVSPQKWMKEILGKTEKGIKGSLVFCQKQWPTVNWSRTDRCTTLHSGLTDAACIALYGLKHKIIGVE